MKTLDQGYSVSSLSANQHNRAMLKLQRSQAKVASGLSTRCGLTVQEMIYSLRPQGLTLEGGNILNI